DVPPPPKHSRLVDDDEWGADSSSGPAGNNADSSPTDKIVVHLADGTVDPTLYHGVKKFEDLGLSPDLLKGIYSMGFQKPSKIQERVGDLRVRL
ncbi:RNA helicase required for poly(A+) mRNA export, partial [Rhizoclosmatium hyalinum]